MNQRRLLTVLAAALAVGPAWAQVKPVEEEPVRLEPLVVQTDPDDEDYDPTGMGSVEQQLRDEPFSNDLIRPVDFTLEDGLAFDVSTELAAVATPSPSERLAGEDRLNLRGFPTPSLRNGFIQLGITETLNTQRTIVIQGALVPVLGRAAPGGIQDLQSARPRPRAQTRAEVQATSLERRRGLLELTGPLAPKKAWHRLAVEWQRRSGPEDFVREELLFVSASVTWRHSRTASTLFSADYRGVAANVTPGVPEFRPAGGGLIAGPYRPLALFNANGPDAEVRRRTASVGVLFDGQPRPTLALRASAEAWWREVVQDRFTTSVLSLDTGLFEGTREPRHLELPQRALVTQLELTQRFRAARAEHKLLVSASHTWGRYGRTERALPPAVRDQLPLSVRRFDPLAPDWYRPPYDPALYARVATDRDETARYAAVEVSDRMAFARGVWVATAGLRYDRVDLDVDDRRPGAPLARLGGSREQLSWHTGVNWQVRPGRLLAYASASTAFDPSTRVDARTGRMQDNETTLGYELGARGRAAGGRLEYGTGAFILFNQHISRRNPLYDDPIADANQTQPQLVASGEERYRGARLEARWQATPAFSVQVRAVRLQALTTASPDLPQEVGRQITRLPGFTAGVQLRYRRPGPVGGWFGGLGAQHLSDYVATYGDTRRAYLDYPGYTLVNASVGRAWRDKTRSLEVELGVRNLLDRDLVASHARLGAGREVVVTTRLLF